MSGLLCLAVAILGFAGVVVTVCVIDLFVRVARLEDARCIRACRRRSTTSTRESMEGRGMGISEKVSESLLAQLDRLEAVDASNADALRMEISRAKAVQGITAQLIANGNMTLEACRLKLEYGEVKVPKGLLG